ncbi:hypothetical protein GQ457_06G007250 [Hibiscus cannabinus]
MESVTHSISKPKESVVKLEVEEICPKSEEKLPQIEEHEQDVTEAEPLAWIPASDGQLQDPQLVLSYADGKIFGLPEGWIVERRPRTSPKYFGKMEKVVSLPFQLFYYEPRTYKQFRSFKAALEHVNQQPPRPENEFEPGAKSLFQRFKDLHEYLQGRKGQQMNQHPQNNNEQASRPTPIVGHGEQQPNVSHQKANEN